MSVSQHYDWRPQGTTPAFSLHHIVVFVCASLPIIAGAWLAGLGCSTTALALLICLITAIPVVLQGWPVDLFAPWNYMFYFIILNVLVRSAFIDFGITGDVVNLNEVFFLDKPPEFLVQSTAVMLMGYVFLTVGYMLPANRPSKLKWRIFATEQYSRTRFKTVTVLMLLTALGALVAFIALTFKGVGDLALNMLSQHRGLSNDLSEYRAYGYLRLLIGMASIVAYLSYLRLRTSRNDRGFYRLSFACAMFISLVMAFYSQSRSALVFVFINIVFIKYYLDGHRFPWRIFAIFAPIAIALFFVTSALRTGSGVELGGRLTPMTVVAPIILNNGGMDASKIGHVIDYIDQTQEYQLGQTLIQFVFAAVPRQVWANKPVNLDTFIGEKIYGAETYGSAAVPPGMFSEMYMNFWYAGIVMGALLLGMLMKKINNLLIGNKRNRNFVIFYVISLQPIGMSVLGSGVSSTVMGTLMTGVPLLLTLYAVTPKSLLRRPSVPAG
jgi:oligosaccharide repeat unit polymerase